MKPYPCQMDGCDAVGPHACARLRPVVNGRDILGVADAKDEHVPAPPPEPDGKLTPEEEARLRFYVGHLGRIRGDNVAAEAGSNLAGVAEAWLEDFG
jgi:hypothetical protein